MSAEQVRTTINRELGRFLYSAREQSEQSASEIAASLGISEKKLLSIEENPAEVPCRELYRLFTHYGPEQMHQAQIVLIEAQTAIFAAKKKRRLGLDSWKFELPTFQFPRWAEILLAVIGGRLIADLLKLAASFIIFR